MSRNFKNKRVLKLRNDYQVMYGVYFYLAHSRRVHVLSEHTVDYQFGIPDYISVSYSTYTRILHEIPINVQ